MAEIIVVFAILIIIFGISLTAFYSSRRSTELDSAAEQVLFKLEQARTSAMAAKYGLGSGIKFGSTTYSFFIGDAFAASSTNETGELPSGYSFTLSPIATEIIFARLTGIPMNTATVTISRTSSTSTKKDIIIGKQGDMMIK